jgi:hypothetical protein
MYRRVAFAVAALALAAGGALVVCVALRPHADVQRIYGAALGVIGLSVGAGQLLGAMSMPAAAGQTDLARAAAAVAGDHRPCRRRDGRRWCRHGRGGGDRQPRSPIPCPPAVRCAFPIPGPLPIRCLGGRRDCSGFPWCEGEAGAPVTVVALPGRRAAGGRPQGRP